MIQQRVAEWLECIPLLSFKSSYLCYGRFVHIACKNGIFLRYYPRHDKKTFLILLAATLTATFPPVAVHAAAEPCKTLTQPAVPPSPIWTQYGGPLPDLDTIIAKAKPNPYIYGLYAWEGEYTHFRESLRKVGWKFYRAGGNFADPFMRMLVEDDVAAICVTPFRTLKTLDGLDEAAYVAEFAAESARLASRYGPGGTFFEETALPSRPLQGIQMGNEPNFQYMLDDGRPSSEQEKSREALYAKMLPAAYQAVKKASPDMLVVGFAAGGAGAGDIRFVKNVHELNPAVAKSYDVFSTHPYVGSPPECAYIQPWGSYSIAASLAALREIFAAHGRADVPVWYTELGWEISKEDGGRYERPADTPMCVYAYDCGVTFTEEDIKKLIRTNLHFMWNGDKENPEWRNNVSQIPGGNADKPAPAGSVWPSLARFDATIRDLSLRELKQDNLIARTALEQLPPPSFARKYKPDAMVEDFAWMKDVKESKGQTFALVIPSVVEPDQSTVILSKAHAPRSEANIYVHPATGGERHLIASTPRKLGEGEQFAHEWDGKIDGKRLKGDYVIIWEYMDGERAFPVTLK